MNLARRSLIKSDPKRTFRISRAKLLKELGIDSIGLIKGHLPRTATAIAEAVESPDNYKVRKLLWIFQSADGDHLPTLGRALSMAGISAGMRTREPFVTAIGRAEELLRQKSAMGVNQCCEGMLEVEECGLKADVAAVA